MPDVNHVSVTFGNGSKREEYGPVKKAEVTIGATIADGEDYGVVLDLLTSQAIAKVAFMLDAPKPSAENTAAISAEPAEEAAPPKRRPGRPPKDAAPTAEPAPASAAPETQSETAPASQPPSGTAPVADEEWSTETAPDVTDEVLLKTMSQAAERLGGKDKVKALLATFATRTEGAPFKAQEIAQPYRQDFLAKLAALT